MKRTPRHDVRQSPPQLAEGTSAKAARRLAAALRHHPAGRLAEAESLYRQVLALDPRQPDGLLLLGTLADRASRRGVGADWEGCRGRARHGRLSSEPGQMLLLLGWTGRGAHEPRERPAASPGSNGC